MSPAAVSTPATETPKRRTARLRLDPRFLSHLLALPPGLEVVAVETSNDPVAVVLILRGDDLPEVVHDAESPYARMHTEAVTLDDGRQFLRVSQVVVPS